MLQRVCWLALLRIELAAKAMDAFNSLLSFLPHSRDATVRPCAESKHVF